MDGGMAQGRLLPTLRGQRSLQPHKRPSYPAHVGIQYAAAYRVVKFNSEVQKLIDAAFPCLRGQAPKAWTRSSTVTHPVVPPPLIKATLAAQVYF